MTVFVWFDGYHRGIDFILNWGPDLFMEMRYSLEFVNFLECLTDVLRLLWIKHN